MKDGNWKLKKKTMLLTDDKGFHEHKNHSNMCSSWEEKFVNSNEMHAM